MYSALIFNTHGRFAASKLLYSTNVERSLHRLKLHSQRTFFLLRNPNYNLVRDPLTTRKSGALKAGGSFVSDCGKTRYRRNLVTKNELDAESEGRTPGVGIFPQRR